MASGADNVSSFFEKNSDAVLAAGVMGILVAIIVPLPTMVLDVLLTFNFAYVLLLLVVVLGITKPLDLSTFPSLLLIGTMLRLALNVASTRLILLNADAGSVIESFGEFVVGGEMIVGLIIFLILIVIQFVVITKGAERISEVGARFTLDAMPGKQMSIDADLNSGLIKEDEARRRREDIMREADFYGAMDGASKYVRGDAIAGIVIVMVNIIGGIVIGLTKGMSIGQALRTYSLLTVGDGLVTQIPAIIMSTSAGILVTKSASGTGLSKELGDQVFANPRSIATAAVIIFGFVLMPGLPAAPFMVLGLALGGIYFVKRERLVAEQTAPAEPEVSAAPTAETDDQLIESLLEPDRVAVEVGYSLVQLVDPQKGGVLLDRIRALRKRFAGDLGIVLPKVRVLDNVELDTNTYRIRLQGTTVGEGTIHPGWLMAMKPDGEPTGLNGIQATEPSFGLPVVWVPKSEKARAEGMGFTVVDAESVFVTHLAEVLKRHAGEILSRQDVRGLLDNVKKNSPAIVDELVPDVLSLGQIQQVLQNLLAERIPINNLAVILEKLGNFAPHVKDPMLLSEFVRKSLARVICARFADSSGALNALSLDPHLEEEIRDAIESNDAEVRVNLSPTRVRQIMAGISEQAQTAFGGGSDTVILVDSQVRPLLRRMISRAFADIPVLAYDEVADDVQVNSVGIVVPVEGGSAAPDGLASAPPTPMAAAGAAL